MREINFIPELFAIPWFLTMFSHVFPLHKIIHLWDKLLLGDSSYPFFIGISILEQLKTTLLSSCFNDCILLFSDLPDIVMETCVIESRKMYLSTPKSITFRKYAKQLNNNEPDEFEINDIELNDLQNERCPRISANDLIELNNKKPGEVMVIDIRSHLDFNRAHLRDSINIPFTSISLSDIRLDALGVPDLEMVLANRNVVVVNNLHESAILFAHFLLDCGIKKVCILHSGFNILHSFVPNVLETS
ncbi:TBC domain-containing protein kinase-like protein isoform X2 [Contarinia nasturtii]|uniref:TBC domain-containing protein kinase-like protein isoform X2 n=1 Tax=Contarinia nasturtii TaxID=265458 RepID=UPI0012D3BEEC|nr:TBC domain-containing protein kinase-like protein isoform X2 [Contarinia nasturtii]